MDQFKEYLSQATQAHERAQAIKGMKMGLTSRDQLIYSFEAQKAHEAGVKDPYVSRQTVVTFSYPCCQKDIEALEQIRIRDLFSNQRENRCYNPNFLISKANQTKKPVFF
ncbi:hypothetical protein AKO1_012976 [Acrasis kona]|uniref:Uncharacterized protein n=1 Tax=Acrasis kona TaxID=1008807 RepID=A0AAW2YZM1_9EUKA